MWRLKNERGGTKPFAEDDQEGFCNRRIASQVAEESLHFDNAVSATASAAALRW